MLRGVGLEEYFGFRRFVAVRLDFAPDLARLVELFFDLTAGAASAPLAALCLAAVVAWAGTRSGRAIATIRPNTVASRDLAFTPKRTSLPCTFLLKPPTLQM